MADYVHISDLPIGTAVYGLNTPAVRAACDLKTEVDTEIWGPFINRPDFFSVHEIQATPGFTISARLTVDNPEDYLFMLALASRYDGNFSSLTLPDIGRILEREPELNSINSRIIQRGLSSELQNGLDNFFSNNESRIREVINFHRIS
jgi:spore coat polysaccharide biosynthesis protein SpsF